MYLTLDEQERNAYLAGTPLPEALLDLADAGETFMEIQSVGDIQAGFPQEDFLDDVVLDLDCIIEQMHGNNKALPALKELSEKLRIVRDTTTLSATYGIVELKKLAKQLGV
jgi:hypothetical protein